MFGLSFQELFIVGVVAILLFGKNLPDVAKKFGGMYRDFRKSLDDLRSQVDFTDTFNSAPSQAAAGPQDATATTTTSTRSRPPSSSRRPRRRRSRAKPVKCENGRNEGETE